MAGLPHNIDCAAYLCAFYKDPCKIATRSCQKWVYANGMKLCAMIIFSQLLSYQAGIFHVDSIFDRQIAILTAEDG